MALIMLKYLTRNPQGRWQYRRDVPTPLRPVIGRREIKKVIGDSQAQAVAAYPAVHAAAEKLINDAKRNGTKALEAFLSFRLQSMGITKETPTDLRSDHASVFLDSFPSDPDTGDPVVPDREGWLYESILHGQPVLPPPDLRAALDFYAQENPKPNEAAAINLKNRLDQVHRIAVEALGKDKELTEWTRGDARNIRDHMSRKMNLKPQSAKRYLGQIASAFNLINRERELGLKNIFKGLSESIKVPPEDRGVPMPDPVADAVSALIERKARDSRLLLAWNLCRVTGARIGEIAGLRHRDLRMEQDIPFVIVRYAHGRSIKNQSSERVLPLLEAQVDQLRTFLSSRTVRSADDAVFGTWGEGNGNDRASAALSDYVKGGKAQYYDAHPVEKPLPAVLGKMTLHSLRHAFMDKCRRAGVDSEVRRTLTGHSREGMDSVYGQGPGLEALRDAVKKANSMRLDRL